jgi:hypothetical protein
MKKKSEMQGEGNHEAARNFNEAERKFVESGRVADAAKNAKPRSTEESIELARAEETGRSRAKEEDPAVHRDGKKVAGGSKENKDIKTDASVRK